MREKRLSVLFDSGASRSFIRSDTAMELRTPREFLIPREFMSTDGIKLHVTFLRFNSRDWREIDQN
jgi:hypothetical protein